MRESIFGSPDLNFITKNLNFLMNGNALGDYCKGPSYYLNDAIQNISKAAHERSFILLAFLKNKDLIDNFDSQYGSFVNTNLGIIATLSSTADSYSKAIIAYTLTLEGSIDYKLKAKNLLEQTTEHSSYTNGDKRHYFLKRGQNIEMDFNNIDIIISAYMALAYMKLDMYKEATPIINWLSANTSPGSNYLEPYDSAMAMEAITEAAKKMSKVQASYTLQINTKKHHLNWDIDSKNWRDYNYKEISKGEHEIKFSGQGKGYIAIDAGCEKYRNESKMSDFLNLTVSVSDDQKTIKTCVICTGTDCKEMIILNVQLQSGFVYVESDNNFSNDPHVKV